MVLGIGGDDPPRALPAVAAVVVDPGLSQHLPPESLRHFLVLLVPTVVMEGPVLGDVEGMRRRPHTDHGPAGRQVVVDLLHLGVGKVAEPRRDHHQVGRPQRLEAGDVVDRVGVDRARLRVDRVEHRAAEAVVPGEDLRQLRERLLAAVFLVAADEHDPPALPRPLPAVDHEPGVGGQRRSGRGRHEPGHEPHGDQRHRAESRHARVPRSGSRGSRVPIR